MSFHWRRIVTMMGFAGCLAMVSSGCVIRAQARVKPVYVVDQAPPQPRYRTDVKVRSGYIWVRGNWQWVSGRWAWKDGYWERARRDYNWVPGHWERRGSRYHWIEGHWARGRARGVTRVPTRPRPAPGPVVRDERPTTAPPGPVVRDERPTTAPPRPRAERPGVRRGYVWVGGHWEWRGRRWAWRPGHWERARTGYVWQPGQWQLRGRHYVWVEGRWVRGTGRDRNRDRGGVRVRDERNPPPEPGRKTNRVPVRPN